MTGRRATLLDRLELALERSVRVPRDQSRVRVVAESDAQEEDIRLLFSRVGLLIELGRSLAALPDSVDELEDALEHGSHEILEDLYGFRARLLEPAPTA